MRKCPQVSISQQEINNFKKSKTNEEVRENIIGTTPGCYFAVNPFPPRVPLAYSTTLSLWCAASCCLVLFHWSIWTHGGEHIKCHTPCRIQTLPPCLAFKEKDEGMSTWKCSSQGSVKEAVSIMPMSISYVEKNKPFLWCLCTHRAATALLQLKFTERVEQIGGELNYRECRLFLCVKLFIWFTPQGYVIIARANLQTSLLAYSYVELFAHIKLCGCPW